VVLKSWVGDREGRGPDRVGPAASKGLVGRKHPDQKYEELASKKGLPRRRLLTVEDAHRQCCDAVAYSPPMAEPEKKEKLKKVMA